MQPLRAARSLTRLVLVWFALALGVAIASPLVQPQAAQLVCTASGMQLVVPGDDTDGGAPAARHQLDCPLCVAVATPPSVVAVPPSQPLGHVLQPIPAARHAVLVAPPLPARGPPSLS